MYKTQFDKVLRPVTRFLEQTLQQMDAAPGLSETAKPLIQAIEAVPGAGRVALFLNNHDDHLPSFVGGESFAAPEIEALKEIVAELTRQGMPTGELEAMLPGLAADRAPHRVRLFPLAVPDEIPAAVLITVRDPVDDESQTLFESFMDQIVQLAGVVVEDRRLRTKLTDQQSFLKVLMDAAPDAIIRIDGQGAILDFLGGASRLFGWRPDEVIGKPVAILIPELQNPDHDNLLDAFLDTHEGKRPDFGRRLKAQRKDGTEFPVDVALSEITGADGVQFISILRDVSRRVEREAELDAMREALDAAALQSALGELAANLAHELIQPVTSIANYMDALELRLQEPTPENLAIAVELARRTAAQARLGGEIIRRTRRMALKGETELRMDDFHAAIADAVSIISKAATAAGVRIELVQTGARDPVLFDRIQIKQVLVNLANNAVRAMGASAGDRRVLTILTHQSPDMLELVVRDTGPGVPDADKDRIFQRFFRRSDTGMGLGLAIVRRIAQAHGGDIHIGDAAGGGAEFRLSIPRREAKPIGVQER